MLGAEALERLRRSCVLVAGLGGVGAFAAEMLARAGVGRLVLVDHDCVTLTNRNRQLLALESTMGKEKTEVMAARLRDINPAIELTLHHLYIHEDTAPALLSGNPPDSSVHSFDSSVHPHDSSAHPVDFVVDAIDTLSPKIALICAAVARNIPLVSSMGAGAKRDATQVRIADISKSYNCPLAFMLRKRLRKMGIRKGFQAVFSTELPDTQAIVPCEARNKKSQVGTISYLPAVFGCVCAQAAIDGITKAAIDGITKAAIDGITKAAIDGITKAAIDGITQAAIDGITKAAIDGITNAAIDGITKAAIDGITKNVILAEKLTNLT